MEDEGKKEEETDSEDAEYFEGEELLSLLLGIGSISEKKAAAFMKVDLETIKAWSKALEEADWIKEIDPDMEDPVLSISKSGEKKFVQFKKDMLDLDEEVNLKKLLKIKKRKLPMRGAAKKKSFRFDKIVLLDILVLLSLLFSIFLIIKFIRDPNSETLSFLASIILFSLAVLTYQTYDKLSKTRNFMDAIKAIFGVLAEIVRRRKKHIIAAISLLVIMYSVGMYLSSLRALFIILTAISISSYITAYEPRDSRKENILFYTGIIILTYSLMLILGITDIVFPATRKSYFIFDLLVGLLGLVILRLKEDYFGINIKRFKGMTFKD